MQTSGNIDDLVKRIREKAEAEAAAVTERAEKVAVREVSKVRDELRAKQAAEEAELEAKLAAGREAINAENAIYERRQIMERQERAIEDVFSLALQQLGRAERPEDERIKLLRKLTGEGLDALKLKEAKAKLNGADRDFALSKNIFAGMEGAAVEVDAEVLESVGGVLLSDMDGRLFYDNTYESRLERLRPELRTSLAKILGF